jgi:quercetin dioxygenase-like cupin family protein
MATVESRNIKKYLPSLAGHDGNRKQIWRPHGKTQPVDAWVYAIRAGRTWPADHYHPGCCELVVVWHGKGTVLFQPPAPAPTWAQWEHNPQWQQQVYKLDVAEGDTIVIPRGAVHRFRAAPNQKLELIVVHMQDPRENRRALGAFAPVAPPVIATYQRNLNTPAYGGGMDSSRRRAKRNRVWGQDPNGSGLPNNPQGAPDVCKSEFHMIQYVFHPGQWNAEHFHPHSVEFVICRRGDAEADVTLPNRPGRFPGWRRASIISFPHLHTGDTLIVPKAALHEYWDAHSEKDLVLLAMQTPQPIMHITRGMIDGQFA